jgi:hypothetical protein
MADFCDLCGANLALVGKLHRCVPKAVSVPNKPQGVPNNPVPNNGAVPNKVAERVARWKAANGDRYRAYMRDLMRARRSSAGG